MECIYAKYNNKFIKTNVRIFELLMTIKFCTFAGLIKKNELQ